MLAIAVTGAMGRCGDWCDGAQDPTQLNKETTRALLDFSYYLTIGNMDAAYQAVRLIKSANVWSNMAHMCVKTKRLDVAEVCLGNMGLAKGAQALRESAKEPEIDARIAMVAIQLGLTEDAEQLYLGCGRYDLLNDLYKASGQWEKALGVAQKHDRVHLRTTHYLYGKHLEALGDFRRAIKHYEASGTHRFEVPRMLFDAQRIADLETYVNAQQDVELFKWWAQYCESNGTYNKALQYYERAQDHLSLVRCCCYKGDIEQAKRIVETTKSPAAAYHVARQLEDRNDPSLLPEAIQYFSLSGQFNHAVRLAKEQGMDAELMTLALQSAERVMLDVARFFEGRALAEAGPRELHTTSDTVKGFLRNAIKLFHKGGQVAKALDLCFRAQLHDELRFVAADLGKDTDPTLMAQCADHFIRHGQYEKAVQLQLTAGQLSSALQLAADHNVNITEEMAEAMTMKKGTDEEENEMRLQLLQKLALCCEQRGNYQLAAKKYTQAGDKLKAMQALLKSGDTDKIIFFAEKARQPKIYILAANYLQSLDWHSDVRDTHRRDIGQGVTIESLIGAASASHVRAWFVMHGRWSQYSGA
jgi:intraflagellar transport protein 140